MIIIHVMIGACVLTFGINMRFSATFLSLAMLLPIKSYADVTPIESCNISDFGIEEGVSTLPLDSSQIHKKLFCKYYGIEAENGEYVHIYAQNRISDLQIMRAVEVLEFYLTDFPGSRYGSDKDMILSQMASNNATLLLLNGNHQENGIFDTEDEEILSLEGQELYEEELVVEGSQSYLTNSPRDATFEEILHLVHDYGIGTTTDPDIQGVLPNYAREIDLATQYAIDHNIWNPGRDWYSELEEEGSLSQEYFASVIDTYYGYWGASFYTGTWGVYSAKDRKDVKSMDSYGTELVSKFLPEFLSTTAYIDDNFEGTFSLKFDAEIPYTHKSRYLMFASLTGAKNSNLVGNKHPNLLSGNSGSNLIDGGKGDDVVYYEGAKDEYSVSIYGDKVIIKNEVNGIEHADVLINVEAILFKDRLHILQNHRLVFSEEFCQESESSMSLFCQVPEVVNEPSVWADFVVEHVSMNKNS